MYTRKSEFSTRSFKLNDVYQLVELIFHFKYTIHKYSTQVVSTKMMGLFHWCSENECRKFHSKAYDTRHLILKDEILNLNRNERGEFSKTKTLGIYTWIIPDELGIIPWINALIDRWI